MTSDPEQTRTAAQVGKQTASTAANGRKLLWTAVVCVVAIVLAKELGRQGLLIPTHVFLPMHLVLEYTSIVVSFAVFTMGWFGYKQTGSARDLIIGVTFITTGAVDFIHTLSYKGMPDFIGANGPGKAAAYWMLARLVVAVGLLAAAGTAPQKRARWLAPKALLAFAVTIIVAPVILMAHYGKPAEELFYDNAGQMLTPLKVALEYIVIIAYAGALVAVREQGGWGPRTITSLRQALVMAILGEFCFTLYLSPYEPMNALGHVFKTISYYFILNGLFVSAILKPYEQLSQAKEELQALYQDAREHRQEIERSFARIGNALSSSLQLREALDRIGELAADMLHADCSIVASTDADGNIRNAAVQRGGCHEEQRPVELTAEVGRRVVRTRLSVMENDLEHSGLVKCDLAHVDCLRSLICSPMIYEGTVLGVVTIFSHTTAAFDDGDVRLLEGFASHAAVAMHNAMSFERESRIADALQKSLLTPSTIAADGFEVAQVYQPAMNEALVGGDFYDVVELPDGRIQLVIGDVSGKGLKAAVHTALVKYTLRAYSEEGHPPGLTLHLLNDSLNRYIEKHPSDLDTFVTVFLGLLDPRTGELVYANAGHEPPIYVIGGDRSQLEATGAALGLVPDARYEEEWLTLRPGSTLLLYTDGISEARRGNDFLGVDRIGEKLLSCESLGCDDIAKCVHQWATDFAGGELRDDAAILAVRALAASD